MSRDGQAIALTLAEAAQRPTIEALLQLYTHDFSEHWEGASKGELDEDGRFPAYPLDPYWSDPA